MTDLLALVAGFAVGALVLVALLALRRGPRAVAAPLPGPAAARVVPAPRPGSRPAPSRSIPVVDHPIRVNPALAAPAPASAPAAVPRAAGAAPPAASASGTRSGAARLERADGSEPHHLGDEPVTLGRGRDQTIRIHDTRASRAHAVVRRRPPPKQGWEVADVGSVNGTMLNGHAIPEGRVAPLRPGDRIGIGGVTVTYFEGPVGSPARPLPAWLRDEPTRRLE